MKRIVLAAFMAVFLCPLSALAQNTCGPHEEIVHRLRGNYGEERIGFGLAGNGALIELFHNAERGTWTFMYTRPDGIACLMAAGGDWEVVAPATEEEAT